MLTKNKLKEMQFEAMKMGNFRELKRIQHIAKLKNWQLNQEVKQFSM